MDPDFKKQVICKNPIVDKVPAPEEPGWVDLSGDGGVLKKMVEEGTGTETPPRKAYCTIRYVLLVLNTNEKIDTRKFTFQLNMGAIDAWDIGVPTMKIGEKCQIRARYDYAYGERGSGANIPACGTLMYDIELIRWEEDYTDLTPPELMVKMKEKKLEGNGCFKIGRWSKAKKRYDRVIWFMTKYKVSEWDAEEYSELIRETKLLEASIWCNYSALFFKQKKWKECIDETTKCLKFYKQMEYRDESKQIRLKLFYRRSICHRTRFDWKLAMKDNLTALNLDPGNKTFIKLQHVLEEKREEQTMKEKKAFVGMFGKWEDMLEQEKKEEAKEKDELQKNIEKNRSFIEEKKRQREMEEKGEFEDSDSDMMTSSDEEEEEKKEVKWKRYDHEHKTDEEEEEEGKEEPKKKKKVEEEEPEEEEESEEEDVQDVD